VDDALINRMGFNNLGADALARRIADARSQLPEGFVIGVNVGRNRDTPEDAALDDYVAAARSVAAVAGYLAINVSSPNTPGLRDLQRPDRLIPLLEAVADAVPSTPLVVKLSPDLGAEDRDRLVEGIVRSPARGLILANSTTSRKGLVSPLAVESGGVSGRPLLPGMLASIARARELAGVRLAVIASGGIADVAGAFAARAAGADLVQLWTGMIYAGPGLIGETVRA